MIVESVLKWHRGVAASKSAPFHCRLPQDRGRGCERWSFLIYLASIGKGPRQETDGLGGWAH